jgi:hypothetical protein
MPCRAAPGLAAPQCDLIETMRFEPESGIALLELHLARMKVSAASRSSLVCRRFVSMRAAMARTGFAVGCWLLAASACARATAFGRAWSCRESMFMPFCS